MIRFSARRCLFAPVITLALASCGTAPVPLSVAGEPAPGATDGLVADPTSGAGPAAEGTSLDEDPIVDSAAPVSTGFIPAAQDPPATSAGAGSAGAASGTGGGSSAASPAAPAGDPVSEFAVAPNTTPILNIAGMNAAAYAPTVRSTFFDVSPDGRRVAIAWLHNQQTASGAFDTSGEPTTYATVGDPAVPGSFTAPAVIGRRTLAYGASAEKKYNLAHNAPFVVADRAGGFLGLSVPMNANGYAEGLPATNAGYAIATLAPASRTWGAQGTATLANLAGGSSLSEMTGNMDPAGNAHLFGQGHRGQFQSGFGYQRRRAGAAAWDSVPLGAAYRATGLNYFCEGGGYAAQVKNAKGFYDIHAAFSWNKAGITPFYGLSYVVSHDGGQTWQSAAGEALTMPVTHQTAAAAVFPANLSATTASGDVPGHSVITVGATDDGAPLVIRPAFTDAARQSVQHRLYTYAGGRWLNIPVGPALFWNTAGSGVAYNATTGKVNVMLLDPGSYSKPARLLLESALLKDLRAGKTAWTEEVIASVKQVHYASSLKVREVKNSKLVALFDGEYHNPGTVQPVLVEARMR